MLSASRTIRQRIAIASIVVVGLGVFALVSPYLGGLLLALVLHVIVAPLYIKLASVLPTWAASLIVIVGVLTLLIVPTAWLASLVIAQLPGAVASVRDTQLLSTIETLRIGPIDVGAWLGDAGGTVAAWAASQATSFLGGFASTMLDLIIALFGVHYLLRSGDTAWLAVRPYIPFSEQHADELLAQFQSATRGTLVGSLLIAVLQGGLVGLAFWTTGLTSPTLWGVVATIASLIPLFGSTIVWIPGVIVLAVAGNYGAAVGMGVFCGVIVASIDNFLRPIVNERISAVHPMITLIGAFAGLRVFGVLGLVLGPLSISYFFVLLRMYREEYSSLVIASSVGHPPEPL